MTIRPRFSLRFLLLLLTCVALVLGWKTNREYQQERAIAALNAAGATVVVADPLPDWAKTWLGPHAGEHVIAVGTHGAHQIVAGKRVGMAPRHTPDLVPRVPMCDIEAFFLLGTSQGDSSFVELAAADIALVSRFETCRYAYLSRSRIGDADVRHLRRLTQLEYLFLGDTQISDAGLAQLRGLKSLRCLYVENTRVTPAGIVALQAAIPGLEICY